MKKNPRFGMHPDLFGGDTPYYIPIESISREELATMKRSNFTKEELSKIRKEDEEVYYEIIKNSPEEQTAATNFIKSEIDRIVESLKSEQNLRRVFQKSIGEAAEFAEANNSKFPKEVLNNINAWRVFAVKRDGRPYGDWDETLDDVSVKFDLSRFNLEEWELEDMVSLHSELAEIVDAEIIGDTMAVILAPNFKLAAEVVGLAQARCETVARYLSSCLT